MSNAFTAPHFQTPQLARAWLEARRWPNGPVCSHCETVNHAYATKRDGCYRCANKECRKDFSVTTGTLMERSHIELNKWLIAFYLMASSKKGVSAHQLHRALGLDYKSAWFLGHRIREAMFGVGFDDGQLGGEGEIVEADETYHGKTDKPRVSKQRGERPYKSGSRGPRDKRPVLALVERRQYRRSLLTTWLREVAYIQMKAGSIPAQRITLLRMRPSSIQLRNMFAAMFIAIRRKVYSQCSSAA
jgi:transposase-like protein